MSGIFIGNATKIFYNTDAGNNIPNAPTYVNIDELAAFPEVKIQSSVNQYDTYNDEYIGIIAANKSIQSVNIVVNYVPGNVTHVFLDSMFTSQTKFQIKVSLYESLTSVIQHYAILSGYVSSATLSGDQNSVVKKTYVFTAEDVIARGTITEMADLKLGDYGVGANGVDIPQYESLTPSGNSFLKVPSTQALNPTGTDLLGIANVDNGNTTKLVMTESGTFSIYGKNQSSSWTQILTKPQSDSAYVPMARTVNGKALSSNITLTPADVSALALSGGTLTGNLNGTTATFTGAVSTGNLNSATGTFTGAVQAPSVTVSNSLTVLNKTTTKDLEATGDTTVVSLTGTTATFSGALSAGATTLSGLLTGTTATFSGALNAGATTLSGLLTGTTATFSGAVTADSLTLTSPLSIANGGTGNTTGLAASATVLATGRTFITNLASTSSASFNGSANVSPGVTGVLPIANGGTGAGDAGNARTNLSLNRFQQFATDTRMVDPNATRQLFIASAASGGDWGVFDVSANAKVPLPVSSGGTGATTQSAGWINLLNGRGVSTARADLGLGSLALLSSVSKNQLDSDLQRGSFFAFGRTNSQGAGVWAFDQTNFGWNETYATTIQISNQATATNAAGNGIWQHYLALGTTGNIIYAYNINGIYGSARIWSTRNTAVDGSGFIKQASPVVRLVSDTDTMSANFTEGYTISGNGAVNEEAEGVVIERVESGVYKVLNSAGLHSDGWQIEVPKDVNGNRLCFVDVDVDENKVITLRIYKPKLDLDTGGIIAGNPIDIPDGRWIDIRLDMPEDSIYNEKMKHVNQTYSDKE